MSDDVERKGLGTPATRAEVIEKLVKDGYIQREIEEYSYEKNGQTVHGYQFVYEKSFPKKSSGNKFKKSRKGD